MEKKRIFILVFHISESHFSLKLLSSLLFVLSLRIYIAERPTESTLGVPDGDIRLTDVTQ